MEVSEEVLERLPGWVRVLNELLDKARNEALPQEPIPNAAP